MRPWHDYTAPLWPIDYVAMPHEEVKAHVLSNAGARPNDRDAVDRRLVRDARTGTGTIKDCVSGCARNAGGFPALARNRRALDLPSNPHGDSDSDGYTNLEEWIHSIDMTE